jgi:hypothetical protein
MVGESLKAIKRVVLSILVSFLIYLRFLLRAGLWLTANFKINIVKTVIRRPRTRLPLGPRACDNPLPLRINRICIEVYYKLLLDI